MAECGACRFDVGWKFGPIEWFFRGWCILFGNYVIDGLFHVVFQYNSLCN